MSNYQGISEIGHSGIQKYLYAIRQAYEYFFLLPKEDACDLFPLIGTKIIQWSIIIVFIGISIAIIIREVQKNVVRGLILACLIAILPLCYYLAFLLSATSPDSFVHAVMLYACSLQFVYYLWLLQYLKRNDFQLINLVKRVSIVLMALLLIMNVKFANVCYLKADIVLSQTKSELTALVTRIKSLEQYADELPVTIIMSDYNDSTIADNESFSDIIIVPYASDTFSSYTYSKQYLIICLEDYCGFAPKYVDSKEFENKAEVLSMPSYPDAGSIQIIDGTIVLKL